MLGEFSLIPFRALLQAEFRIVGVVLPPFDKEKREPRWLPRAEPPKTDFPLLQNSPHANIATEASRRGIPVLELGGFDAANLLAFRSMNPDLAMAACFPRLIPAKWLNAVSDGFLNLHPSLLPAYRGPAPLFWQFRAGEENMGVTVHFMDAAADTGDIVAQTNIEFPDGITAREADRLAASALAELLIDVLCGPTLPRRAQPAHGAGYQPRPREQDRIVPADWLVRRAFRFFRGADEWAPFWIELPNGQRVEVWEAISYEEGAVLNEVINVKQREIWVRLSDGVLRVSGRLIA